MSKTLATLAVRVHTPDGSVRLGVPTSAFSSAAEQLRWDALRSGQLDADEWSGIRATVVPTDERGIAIRLNNVRREVCRHTSLRELQRVQLYLVRNVPAIVAADAAIEYVRNEPEALDVPLAPLALPFEASPGTRRSPPPPLDLVIRDSAQQQLASICRESLEREVELGGGLIGRVTIDTLIVEGVARASDDGGSAAGFSFDPRFWPQVTRSHASDGQRIIGWVHSHLCEKGHPREISQRDLTAAYEQFSAPWSLTALVCAAHEKPECLWYGWQDGALVELGGPTALNG